MVPTELKSLAIQIQTVMQQTGKILKEKKQPTLAAFILDQVKQDKDISAAKLVNILVSTFPAFADIHSYNGKKIHIIKKAQLLVGDLYRRFSPQDERFKFKDIHSLTVFSDNVLPAVLRKVHSSKD
jgi:hypothetical protein